MSSNLQASADNLTDSLTTTLTTAIDIFFPLKSTKLHTTDKPWISHAIKSLIQKRQNAFNNIDPVLWRHYKNKVKKEISKRKKHFTKIRLSTLRMKIVGNGGDL
jgi:predicted CopG family antitoxin